MYYFQALSLFSLTKSLAYYKNFQIVCTTKFKKLTQQILAQKFSTILQSKIFGGQLLEWDNSTKFFLWASNTIWNLFRRYWIFFFNIPPICSDCLILILMIFYKSYNVFSEHSKWKTAVIILSNNKFQLKFTDISNNFIFPKTNPKACCIKISLKYTCETFTFFLLHKIK